MSTLLLALGALGGAVADGADAVADDPSRTLSLPGGSALTLWPADVRSAALAAADPAAADGLWAGRTADGALVHLAEVGGMSAAVVASAHETLWLTVVGDQLVPLALPAGLNDEPVDVEIEAPEVTMQETEDGAAATGDGVLQVAVGGDAAYHARWGDAWPTYQLAVFHLVGALYAEQLGVPVEVVDQKVWPANDPFTGAEICTSSPSVLRQFRDHGESADAVGSASHEAAHLFTGRTFSTSVIGCAYIRQIETAWAYGVSRILTGPSGGVGTSANLRSDVVLVAHELGHNANGHHGRAAPRPGGPLDRGCLAPATIMYPCLGAANLGVFSDATADPDRFEALGVAPDGGNVPHMSNYLHSRI